jgi:hypothetical protein
MYLMIVILELVLNSLYTHFYIVLYCKMQIKFKTCVQIIFAFLPF